jgi:uncharacterized protein YndB with AHSA1/START domain
MQLDFETEIRASPATVFGLLADLRGYDRWLPHSSAFRGTVEISDGPIGVGTTYAEPTPNGVRHGRITVYEPNTRLRFEQPMTIRPRGVGVVEITVDVELTPAGDSAVHLRRTVTLSFSGPIRFVRAFVRRPFLVENGRLLAALKAHAEAH